jgi:hypothetical protein
VNLNTCLGLTDAIWLLFCENLETLSLEACGIKGKPLVSFVKELKEKCPKLEKICLHRTQITEEAEKELRNATPGLKISIEELLVDGNGNTCL